MSTTTTQVHTLRSSRQRPTVLTRPTAMEIFQNNGAPSTNQNSLVTTYLAVPVDSSKEDRRRRRKEKLNKPLPSPPPPVEMVDTPDEQFDVSLFLPRKVCKHLHRIVKQELKSDQEQHSRFKEAVRVFNLITPHSAVSSLLESRHYHERLDDMLKEANLDKYYSMSPKISEARKEDQVRMVKLVKYITRKDTEKAEVLESSEDDAEELMDAFQEILDAGLDDIDDRARLKQLMSTLVRKTSGLPDSMFISGVSLSRGQCSIGGTFGDIYQTMYRNQPVALKFLRVLGSSPAEKRKTCKKFYKEARVWHKLDFKYILPFLGVDTENFPGRPCMVSPWMINGNAHQFVKRHPKMNVDKLLFEIAQGIQYLHSKLVVHGDIKGLNIMIDEQWHPRLADFGLTIWADATRQDTTQHGGTVRWMAPELLNPIACGHEDSQRTFATDVYAYGCLCLELYTRRNPFYDIHSEAVVSMRVSRGERPERPVDHPFSDGLWSLVNACWHRDAQMRPHCSEVVENLKIILRKSAVEGGLDGLFGFGSYSTPSLLAETSSMVGRGSILRGVLYDEPAEMDHEKRMESEFEAALLQIRQHADPSRMYIDRRKLQKGFSVQVFHANTTFNTPVTIKQINIERQNKAKIVDLVNEFIGIRFLHDDNVVGYMDMFRYRADFWVIEEDSTETISLRKVFKTSENEVGRRELFLLKILPSLLRALDYLHRHGVTHGYVGMDDVVFNKAAHVRLKMGAMFPDQQNIQWQRPRRPPPEIVDGTRYGSKADIWNLGFLIIESLDTDKIIELDQAPEEVLLAFKTELRPSSAIFEIVSAALQPYHRSRPSAAEMMSIITKVQSVRHNSSLL